MDQQILVNGTLGTLSGSDILWADSPATQFGRVVMLNCSGAICASLGLNQGPNPPPPQIPEARFGQSPALGHWRLSDDLSQILGSTRAVFTVGGVLPPPGPAEPAEWLVFGDADLGFVAEPSAGALLLLAFGVFGWGVRQRAATAR